MKIAVLGQGCRKCQETFKHVEQALTETGQQAELEKVTDLNAITAYGVMLTPALAVDGEVKVSGRVPKVEEIKTWLKT